METTRLQSRANASRPPCAGKVALVTGAAGDCTVNLRRGRALRLPVPGFQPLYSSPSSPH
jgi:hypothetical protein